MHLRRRKVSTPPTIRFFKHFLVRLSEISYRIGLFAIFWTVIGGQAFTVLMAYEMLFPLFYIYNAIKKNSFDIQRLFLTLNMVCKHF